MCTRYYQCPLQRAGSSAVDNIFFTGSFARRNVTPNDRDCAKSEGHSRRRRREFYYDYYYLFCSREKAMSMSYIVTLTHNITRLITPTAVQQ